MRDFRLPLALAIVASFSLAGCAGLGGEASAPTEPASSTGGVVPKGATADSGRISDAAADKPAVPASVNAERAASSTPRDDSPATSERLVAQLNAATREIASLRVSNAKLKASAPQPAAAPVSVREPDPADAKLAASFHSYAQFKQELAGFFADIEKLRAENATLNAKLKDAASGSQDVKATFAKLEAELKSEKAGRAQAEQTTAKLREQLRTVAAAVSAAGLSVEPAAVAAEPTARLETSRARLRAATGTRQHVVKEGDTLETLADFYYHDPTKWRLILDANRARLPLDGVMPVGLELEIPTK